VPVVSEIPGSCPGNVAFSLRALGHTVGISAAFGTDRRGELYRSEIERYRMTLVDQRFKGERVNPYAHILFTDGKRTIFAYRPDEPKISLDSTLPEATFVYTSGIEVSALGRPLVDLVIGYSGKLAFDIASPNAAKANRELFRALESYINVLFTSVEEYEAMFERGFNTADPLQTHPNMEFIALKQGAEGSIIYSHHGMVKVPVVVIDQADFINDYGAGDGYAAGVISALLRRMDMEQVGELGARVAADVIKQQGPHLDFIF